MASRLCGRVEPVEEEVMLRSFGLGRDMVDDALRAGYVGCRVSILL